MDISRNWFKRQVVRGLVMLLVAPLANAMPRQQAAAPQPAQQNAASAKPQAQTAPARQPTVPARTLPESPTPAGTAAAPYQKPVGAAVSRPAGAAIAPAKQKRRRSILIRTGLVIGAAIAVGTVVALSKSSPSRPNN